MPLLSGITNAWVWTIDKRLGLFSGATSAADAAAAAAARCAAAGAGAGHAHDDGRGDVVDMLAEDHGEDDSPHDEAMLQVGWG